MLNISGAYTASEMQNIGLRPHKSPSLGINRQPIAEPKKTIIAIRAVAFLGLQHSNKDVYRL